MSQFRLGLNKNANNPQSRRSVKATSWKAKESKRHIKLHERIMTSMRRTRGVPVGRFLEFPGYFDFWFTVFFFFFFFFCHTQHFLCGRFMSWDMAWWPFSHSPSLCPSLISSPAAVAHFAAWALFMVQHLRSVAQLQLQFCWTGLINLELGISQLIYIKPNAGAFSSRFSRQKGNCVGDDSATPTIIWLNLTQ